MPVPHRPLSPLLPDNISMNDERKLPPITTQLADYFPRSRPKTPPRTPDGRDASKKRKLSFERYDDLGAEVQGRWKRSMTEASAAWPRPATAHEGRSGSTPTDHIPPGYHRNSIAVPPRASDQGRPAPTQPGYHEAVRAEQQRAPVSEWQKDPPLFKLPSPTKPPFGTAGPELSATGTSGPGAYDSKPQPIHIGESHSAPLPPLRKTSLGQQTQYATASDHKQQQGRALADTYSVSSSRDTPHTLDSWRRGSTSSKSTSNNNSAGADPRGQEFPGPSSNSGNNNHHYRWTLDSQFHSRAGGPKPDESPRSPRDRRPLLDVGTAVRPGAFEPSNAPTSASTERSQGDSRYAGRLSASSPTAATDPIRRNSHALLESPRSQQYHASAAAPPAPSGAGPPPSHLHPSNYQPQPPPRYPDLSRRLEYGTAPPPAYTTTAATTKTAEQQQHRSYGRHAPPPPPPPPPPPHHLHQNPHSHPHYHGDHHESPTTPRMATGEGRSQYTWEVPGMTGEHVQRKRRGNLPKESTSILNSWFSQHTAYPYPKEEEKQRLQAQTGLSMSQISNWFINARRRRRPSITAANEENWLQSPTSTRRRTRS